MSARILLAVGSALGLSAVAPSAPAATPSDPLVMVNSLYLRKASPSDLERLFAADIAAASRRRAAGFDWRYGARRGTITDLRVFWAPPPEASGPPRLATRGPGRVSGVLPPVETPAPKAVEAAFRNSGEPHVVFYSFCRTPRGELRIADVYALGRDRWSLRRRLGLDPERVRC